MSKLVLYHDNCADGFFSAFMFYLIHGRGLKGTESEVTYLPVRYGEKMPDVKGKDVYIFDFSYPPKEVKEASEVANSITLLDHHLSALKAWLEFYNWEYKVSYKKFVKKVNEKLFVSIDMDLSGVGLVWNKYKHELLSIGHPNKYFLSRVEAIKNAIQDRDLWKFQIPDTREICAGLSLVDKTLEDYNDFINFNNIDAITRNGIIYLKGIKKLQEEVIKNVVIRTVDSFSVPVVNCPKSLSSEVGSLMLGSYPFSMSYEIIGENVVCSLRSNDSGEDVSLLAKKLGNGGGHRNASGFITTLTELDKILNTSISNVT